MISICVVKRRGSISFEVVTEVEEEEEEEEEEDEDEDATTERVLFARLLVLLSWVSLFRRFPDCFDMVGFFIEFQKKVEQF